VFAVLLFSCVFWIRIFPRINNLTFQTRTTAFSKEVLVPKRDKKKHKHFLYPVNHLYQRYFPSAPLVSKEIETNINRRRFFPKVAGHYYSLRKGWGFWLRELVRPGG